ncbi:MAG: pyrroline-5-carboxylate reductase [Candidatus Latescibacteria bacterium]|nr:pyrroline-5-carboxylate reductase [Candidatus Latescibacterota bacterium]
MLHDKKIAVIGTGNMGSALIEGLLASGAAQAFNIVAFDVDEERLTTLAAKCGIRIGHDNASTVHEADIVLLAVKPQMMNTVLDEIVPVMTLDKIVISIAAGVKIAAIEERLRRPIPVLRVMPNILATVRSAVSALCPGRHASREHLTLAREVMEAVGTTVDVEEKQMDAVTGLSGSGPAYVFVMIDALADGGVKMGLTKDVALKLATQTVLGAAKMVVETGKHPMVLKDAVTSPGGTTIAGLHVMEREGVRNALISAVEAATKRSEELGK